MLIDAITIVRHASTNHHRTSTGASDRMAPTKITPEIALVSSRHQYVRVRHIRNHIESRHNASISTT